MQERCYTPNILKDGFVKPRFRTPADGNTPSGTLAASPTKQPMTDENYGTFRESQSNSSSGSSPSDNETNSETIVQINKEDD